jgi:AcrR family transcriptional regulator
MYVARISQAERRETADRRLLKAACRIISGNGLSALTCEDVGRLAGYSRGQTYQRFGSKEGLLIAAVERLRAYRRECVTQAAQRGKSGIEELIDYCGLHLGALDKGPEFGRLFRCLVRSGTVQAKAEAGSRCRAHGDFRRDITPARSGEKRRHGSGWSRYRT